MKEILVLGATGGELAFWEVTGVIIAGILWFIIRMASDEDDLL